MPLSGPGQDPAVLVAVLTYLPLPARLLRAGLERGLNAARGQYKYWAELRSGQGLLRPGGAAERRSVQYRDLFVPPRCSHARSQARGASPAVSLPAPIACGITRCPRANPPRCFHPPGSHQLPAFVSRVCPALVGAGGCHLHRASPGARTLTLPSPSL